MGYPIKGQGKKLKKTKKDKNKGFLRGLLFGLISHIACIAFILFSVLGATAISGFFRPLLLNAYFFYILIAISLFSASLSALFYLKQNGILTLSGIKRKKGYLLALCGTTIGVNLLLFLIIFPLATNFGSGSAVKNFTDDVEGQNLESMAEVSLEVKIPCSGHAPLIVGELEKAEGVRNINYQFPNIFRVSYLSDETSIEQMVSLDIFEKYSATVFEKDNS